MSQKLPSGNPVPSVYLRMGLLIVLFISGMVIVSSVGWIYRRIHNNLGFEIAEVVVAFLIVLIFILILFGFAAGLGADQILRRRKIQALWISRVLKRSSALRAFRKYIEPNGEIEKDDQHTVEVMTILEQAPRRGRPPTYSLDRWIRVVQAWENRDPLRNTMTLCEFLAEQFGVHADGSPRMSENSYYDWRKKVFKELRKMESGKKEKTPVQP